MSSAYDDPRPEHRNALREINEARQRALKAVSEMRKVQISTPHPNLAQTSPDGTTAPLPVVATQAVVDYLLQLRPYRATSRKWNVDFGSIELPRQIAGAGVGGSDRPLWICQQPKIKLNDVSQLIESMNQTVHYSTNRQTEETPDFHPDPCRTQTVRYEISPDGHSGTYWVDRDTHKAIQKGAMTADEVVEIGATLGENHNEDESDGYTPAIPSVNNAPGDTANGNGELRSFKFVLGPQYLLQVVELADEVAAEMDLLIELDDPDYSTSGGDAA